VPVPVSAPRRIDPPPADREALRAAFEATRDADTRLRYQMVLLAADGRTAPQIAPIVQRSDATVQRVLHRYQAGGVAAVPYRPRPGAAPVVTPAWEAELRRVIESDPHEVGVARPLWTTGLLASYLAEHTGVVTSAETVRRSLHRFDYVCKRPTWTLKRKAEEQPDWAGNG
jgi:transposase